MSDHQEIDELARELWEAHATHHQQVIPFPQLHWDELDPFSQDHWRHIARTAKAFFKADSPTTSGPRAGGRTADQP